MLTRTRTCEACGADWADGRARWCGACGAALARPEPPRSGADRGRGRPALWAGIAIVAVAAVMLPLLHLDVAALGFSGAWTPGQVRLPAGGPAGVIERAAVDDRTAPQPRPQRPIRCPREGCIAWDHELPAGTAPPTVLVDDDLVVAHAGGMLFGFDLVGGMPRWRVTVGTRDAGSSTHLVVGERVLSLVEVDGGLVAVDRHDGRIRWRAGPVEMRELLGAIEVDGTLLVVGRADSRGEGSGERVAAFEVAFGAPLWQADAERVLLAASGPVLVDGRVLSALHAADGSVRWSTSGAGASAGRNATALGDLLVLGPDTEERLDGEPPLLRVLDASDGSTRTTVDARRVAPMTAPRVDGPLLQRDSEGVTLLEADGRHWTAPTPEGGCCAGQALHDDTVVVQLTRDRLLTLDRATGERIEVGSVRHVAAWGDLGAVHGLVRFRVVDSRDRLVGYSIADGRELIEVPAVPLTSIASGRDDLLLLALPGRLLAVRMPPVAAWHGGPSE